LAVYIAVGNILAGNILAGNIWREIFGGKYFDKNIILILT
jgi:hypothetical protein